MTPIAAAAADSGPSVAIALGLIIVLGIGAQWVAWRVRVPSILLLLICGLLAGPVMRSIAPGSAWALDPTAIFGDELLLSFVGVFVGLILYEGGLTLRFREIRSVKRVVIALVTVGAAITWFVAASTGLLVFGLSPRIAALLGAILIVTGPTVVGPMLAHIRPAGAIGPVLKWEGIVIDPIGVIVAVLVFEAIITGYGTDMASIEPILVSLGRTIAAGAGLGIVAALVMLGLMRRYWIPDFLQSSFSLALVVAVYTLANVIQDESGLLATTVMGIVLANQKSADVRHILEFKENLRVLLISVLFIVLAARLEVSEIRKLDIGEVAGYLVVLILVARPLASLVSTWGAGLSWNERLFVGMMAPRGIVAAAAASIFALELEEAGIAEATQLIPITFVVIIGTVTFYGIAAPIGARYLGIADQNPQGVLFVGASRWVRAVASALNKHGYRVLLLDTNRAHTRAARMQDLPVVDANALDEWVAEELDLRSIGRVLAVTPNEEVNTLVLHRFAELFDKSGLYTLPMRRPKGAESEGAAGGFGRSLFSSGVDADLLEQRLGEGWVVKATTLSSEFDFNDYSVLYGGAYIPLFVITATKNLAICTAGRSISPSPGEMIISLVNPEELLMAGLKFGSSTGDEEKKEDG